MKWEGLTTPHPVSGRGKMRDIIIVIVNGRWWLLFCNDYIIVLTKTQQWLPNNEWIGHNSRRSAWERDRRLWMERFWEKKSFKMSAENATRTVNKRSSIRIWRWWRAGWCIQKPCVYSLPCKTFVKSNIAHNIVNTRSVNQDTNCGRQHI